MKRLLAVIALFLIPNICSAADNTRFAQFTSDASIPREYPSFIKTTDALPEYTSPRVISKDVSESIINNPHLSPIQPIDPKINKDFLEQAGKVIDKAITIVEPILERGVKYIKDHPEYGPIQPIGPKVYEPLFGERKPIDQQIGEFVGQVAGFVNSLVDDSAHGKSEQPDTSALLIDRYWTEGTIIQIISSKEQALETGAIPTDMYLTPGELRELDAKGLQQTGKSNFYTKDLPNKELPYDPITYPEEIIVYYRRSPIEIMVKNLVNALNPINYPSKLLPAEDFLNPDSTKNESTIIDSLNIPTMEPGRDWGTIGFIKTAIVPNDTYLTPQQLRELNQHDYSYVGTSNNPNGNIEFQVIGISNPNDPEGGRIDLYTVPIDKTDKDGTVHYTIPDVQGRHNHYYGSPDSLPWYTQAPIEPPASKEQTDYNGNGVFQNGDGADYSGFDGYGQEGFGEPRSEGSNYDPYDNYIGPND